ncbi:MAG: polyprenyl synthetase family protein [Candidatus Hodarchaeales archaeon]
MSQQFLDPEILKNLNERLDRAIKGLPSPIRERIFDYIFMTKGKQLRPSLIALTTKFLTEGQENRKEAMEHSYTAAVAIELLHNMTLIHDDLIDNAPVRRGKDAFHIIHGRDRALHDGDILHAYALTLLKDYPSLQLVLDYAYQVGIGNSIELEDRLTNNFEFDLDHVIKIMELKTAIVFSGCVELGCLAANRQDLFTERLSKAITSAGVAFQIQDDYLDILGNPEKFGKVQYWDIQESKRNLFLYFALKTDHAPKIKEIYRKEIGEKTEKDIEYILEVFRSVNDEVRKVRDQYAKFALDELEEIQDGLDEEDENADALLDFLTILVKYLVEREK